MQTLVLEENVHFVKDYFEPFKPQIVIASIFMFDQVIANYLQAEVMKFSTYHYNALASGLGNFPGQYTYAAVYMQKNSWHLKNTPYDNPWNKLFELIGNWAFFMCNYQYGLYPSDTFQPEFQNYKEVHRALYWGYGIEGIRDTYQWPSNQVAWNPANRFVSKVHPESTIGGSLDGKFTEFMDRYDQVILVSFGATFLPSLAKFENLVQALGLTPEIGVIISVKKEAYIDSFKSMNLPNLMIEPFVPQKELLAHPKLQAFITHCGATSVMESIYYGVPLLGLPIDGDQFGMCTTIENLGIGYHESISGEQNHLSKQLKDVL